MHDSMRFNSKWDKNLFKERAVKVRRFPGAAVEDIQHYVLPIIWKKPRHMMINADAFDAARSALRDILDKLL